MEEINEKCYDCYWYWQNNDTENECNGQKEPCHEFVEFRGAKMGRLTMTDAEMRKIGIDFDCPVKLDNEGVVSDFCNRVCDEFQNNCPYSKMAMRLKYYEDLEEQGLLLKLPCKVGDKLYKPYYFNRKAKGIDTIVVNNMVVEFDSEEGERAYIVGYYENTNCGVDADFSEIGEVVHIHKEEAEKALEELSEVE